MLSPEEQSALDLLLKKKNTSVQPTVKSVRFTNWTDEDFTHNWDRVPYMVKAHETVVMQDWLALHLAKHLAERELNHENDNRPKGEKEQEIIFTPKRDLYIKKALGETVSEAGTATELAIKTMNLPEEKELKKALPPPLRPKFEGMDVDETPAQKE